MTIKGGNAPIALTPTGATTTGAGNWVQCIPGTQTFQAVENGTSGAFSATVTIQVSNDGQNPVGTVAGTMTLSGTATTADSAGFSSNMAWVYVRYNVTAISGTGAAVTVTMGG